MITVAGQSFKVYYWDVSFLKDFIGGFLGGVDSGVNPHLLPRNKLAWMVNGTVRGGYCSPRPKFPAYNFTDGGALVIGGSNTCANFVQNGVFQGATEKSYHPNKSSILPGPTFFALISGRLFGFTPDYIVSSVGVYSPSPGSIALKEFTPIISAGVPDLNSITATQAWLGQAENYLIIQDGSTPNPLVFDGNNSFRSLSLQTQIAVFNTASTNVAPSVGSTLTVSSANFSTAPTTTTPQPLSVYSGATGAFIGQMSIGFPPAGFYDALLNTTGAHTFTIGDAVYLQSYATIYSNQTLAINASYPFAYANNLTVGTSDANNANTTAGFVAGSLTALVTVQQYKSQSGAPFGSPMVPGATTQVTSSQITPSMISSGSFNIILPSDPYGSNSKITAITLQYQTSVQSVNATYTPIGVIASTTSSGSPYGVTFTNSQPYPSTSPSGATVFVGSNSSSPGSNFQCTISSAPAPGSVASYILTNQSVVSGTSLSNCVLQTLVGIPCGKQWAYCQGRIWTTLPSGTQFVAGDIVGGSSGTAANNFLDAILYTMQNTLLSNGGTFSLPGNYGSIRAMVVAPTMNVALGQGPLQVMTAQCIFSVNAPADITTWASLTTPIVTVSLIGAGALGQWSSIPVNGDILFRAPDGIRSMTIASLDFYKWNNTPCSHEVGRAIDGDQENLLDFCSAVQFDNRIIFGCSPVSGANGTTFQNAVVINLDSVSNLQSKSPSVWDGVWQSVNALQLMTGVFHNTARCFMFTSNGTSIGLSEILSTTDGQDIAGTDDTLFQLESPVLFDPNEIKGEYDLLRLEDGEVYFQNLLGLVTFTVEFRPDYDPNWHLWYSWTVDNTGGNKPYATRMGLGCPIGSGGSTSGNQNRDGYDFQVRITISTGSAQFMGAAFKASKVPKSEFAMPIVNVPVPPAPPAPPLLKQMFAGFGAPTNQNPGAQAGIYFDAANQEFYLWLGTQWDGGITPTGATVIAAGCQAFAGSGAPTPATPTPANNAGSYFDYTNSAVYFWNPLGYWGDDVTANGGGAVASLGQDYFNGNGAPTTQKPADGAGMYYDLTTLTLYNWNTTNNTWI
jgi:hypothetical protein